MDGIIGSLKGVYGETAISKAMLHIEDGLEGFNIYVPKDSKDQEICYLRLLPTKLFNEIMIEKHESNSTFASDPSAVSIISAILASSDEVIDLVLEEAGIVPVPYPDQYEEELRQSTLDNVLLSPDFDQQRDAESETASIGSGTGRRMAAPGARTLSQSRVRIV